MIVPELSYKAYPQGAFGINQSLHVISFEQTASDFNLILSKVSEAILPDTLGNHIGEGASMDAFLQVQPEAQFVINGGFNHYRAHFYEWSHQNFHVGDPVGVVKIREHYFEDYLDIHHYGFLAQKDKFQPWCIIKPQEIMNNPQEYKYLLGCTPLLVYHNQACLLPEMQPVGTGKINPPSFLGHGLQKHPRTAVGMKNDTLYFIIVDAIHEDDGCTLPELQNLALNMGLSQCLNLDGGGSSQFRLKQDNSYISNTVHEADKKRVLGHVLAIFPKRKHDYI